MSNALPAQTITIHVEAYDAERLIGLAGGIRVGTPTRFGGWDLNGKHYWHTDEALTVALEAISDSNGIAA